MNCLICNNPLYDSHCYTCNPYNNEEIAEHDYKLYNILSGKSDLPYDGMKILIFQPVAAGDNIIASLGAELLQIKYPGCSVDFFTTLEESATILEANPFIDKVIVEKDWELYNSRATESKPSIPGPLRKEYDLSYSLYWWNAPMVKSFLEDMELPTDYTHVRIYHNNSHNKGINEIGETQLGLPFITSYDVPRIALQNRESLRKVWDVDKHYDNLLKGLEEEAFVFEIGKDCGMNFIETARFLSYCDLFIGYHGSQEHMAAAVNCQTVVMSREWRPEDALTAYYQNKYMPANKQHKVVRPKKWCENFERCVTYNPDQFVHKLPPYGFPNKFPPHKYKDCDFGYEKSCIYNGIMADDVLEKVREALQ